MDNTKRYISTDHVESCQQYISCGVAQGSILDPLLLIVYINDLNNVSSMLKLIMFADDTNIFIKCISLDIITTVLNCELDKLCVWFAANL